MIFTTVAIAWIVIGTAVGFHEVRRGHWRWLWLLGAIAGPVAIPLARLNRQNEPYIAASVLSESSHADSLGLHVLAGIDGSPESLAAVHRVVEMLGTRLGELTLAMVVDFETADTTSPTALAPENPYEERDEAKAVLADAAELLRGSHSGPPGTVLLAGRPSDALQRHAHGVGADVMVVGRRGQGLTKHLLGSCASELARRSVMPVIIMPVDGSATGPPLAEPGEVAVGA